MTSTLPVSVNIVVNDPQCAAYMSNVGIFIMYYCEQCGLASRSLWDVTNHLAANRPDHVNGTAENIKNCIDSIVTYVNSQIVATKVKDQFTPMPPEKEQISISSESDTIWNSSLHCEKTTNIINSQTDVSYNSCNEKKLVEKVKSCTQENYREQGFAGIENKGFSFVQDKNNYSAAKMHSYNSVDQNKYDDIIQHFTSDEVDDQIVDILPVTEHGLQNFTESDCFNLVGRNNLRTRSHIHNIPAKGVINEHVSNNLARRHLTEGCIIQEDGRESKEIDKPILYIFSEKNNITTEISQIEEMQYPALLSAGEKELLFTSYMAFVKECVNSVLFNTPTKNTDKYNVMTEVVKYDSDRFKTKYKTVDSVFMHSLRNVCDFELSCNTCPRLPFSSQKEFDIHMKCHTDTVEGFQFECYICKKWKILNVVKSATKEWPEMRSHLINNHKEMFDRITCSHCTLEFQSQHELRDHRNLVHREYCIYKTKGCKFCTFNAREAELHNSCHYMVNENSGDFKCPNCPLFVSASVKCSWLTLKDHIARKHPELLDQTNMCPGCNCSFLDQETFVEHYVTCDRMEHVRHRCLICTQSNDVILPNLERHLVDHVYSEKNSSQQRIRKIVDLLKVNTPMLTIYSMYCKPQLPNDHTSSVHTVSVENVQDQKGEDYFTTCETQDESVEDQSKIGNVHQSVLINHVKSCHPEDSTPQTECTTEPLTSQPSTDDLSAYESNVQVLADGTFRCKLCYKTRKTAAKFIRHMANSHPNGTDETTCDQCGKIFRTKSLYRNHYFYKHQGNKRKSLPKVQEEKTAKTKKIYKCEKCSYTTPHTTRLRNHTMSVHMGVMPYHCTMCTYQSNELSDMKRHKNNHFGIKQHACEHCDYKAKQYWLLKTHCWKQHFIRLPSKRATLMSSAVLLGTAGSLRRNKNKAQIKHSRTKTTDISQIVDPGSQSDLVKTSTLDGHSSAQTVWNPNRINVSSNPAGSNPNVYQVIAVDNTTKQSGWKGVELPGSASRTVPINSNRGIGELAHARTSTTTGGINCNQITGNTHCNSVVTLKLDKSSGNNIITSEKTENVDSSRETIAEIQNRDLEIQILRLDSCDMDATTVMNDNVTVIDDPKSVNVNRISLPAVKSISNPNNQENVSAVVSEDSGENFYTEENNIPVYVIPEGTVVESMTEVEYHVVIDDSTVNE